MRALVYIPLTVLTVAGGGWVLSRAVGANPAPFELLLSGGACLAAGTLAALPPFIVRHATQPTVAQAALISTMIHLFGCAAVAAFVYMAKVQVGRLFPYWLVAFYFSTLIVLVATLAQQIKSAPVGGPADRH